MQPRTVSTIRNQVYQILKEEICGGAFDPGQWLQEKDLADRLSVSRSPVREALRQLAADGLVVEYPNKGVFVKEVTSRDIEEIYDLRVLMENHAISRLKGHLSTSGIEMLVACLAEMETAYAKDDLRLYTHVDARLHSLLISLSDNSLLVSTYERMLTLVQQFRIYSLISRKRFDESIEEHRGIVHAILKGDLPGAQVINQRHLELAHEKILEYLAKREKPLQAEGEKEAPRKPM